ncbi:MAG: HlyD family efflux transporter periplasmic adaptor subunit [Gemmatimonadetes bacterium]|nr:HlyD family efflux transporter periplasmic adaptor subunit [Gemmatimonadota bacterium]
MRKRLIVIIPLLIVAGITAGVMLNRNGRAADGVEASGTVEATDADLGFHAGGRIEKVLVREGERVTEGQVLAVLEAADLEARLAQAEAQLAAARARLSELEHGTRPEERAQAEAAAHAAERRLDEAKRVMDRTRTLYEGGAVSREAWEQTETAWEVAGAAHTQAVEQVQLVLRGPRVEQIAAQRALVRQAEAGVAQAQAALEHAIVRAPFAGIITDRHREPGESVSAGTPVVTLMDPSDRWVRIYVREDRIGMVALGQDATIRTDSDPDSAYGGRVVHIANDAEFTPRNVQTTEERVRLVYAVRVAITGDDAFVLKPGIPADVSLAMAGR